MNIDLKKTISGIIILFLIFCAAFIINRVLDRTADDSIIISSEENTETEEEPNTEEETESQTVTEKLSGYLKYESENGDVYEGNMKNGNYDGDGVLTRKTGEIYDGFWIDGAFDSGEITFKLNNFGQTKTINIVHDEKWDGKGKHAVISETGEIYDGQWYDGEKNGDGILYSRAKNGAPAKVMEGIWEDDVVIEGTETYIYDDGLQTYVVEVKDGFRNGKGILYDEKGAVKEEEEWLDDIPIEQ